MPEKYLSYYMVYSVRAPIIFIFDMLFRAKTSGEKISLNYRLRDYLRLQGQPQLLVLHRKINSILFEATRKWPDHDYGEGYFYQSCNEVRIGGLRDTAARVEAMHLRDYCKNAYIIDIGCNSGFLDIAIAPYAKKIIGFDINPFIIDIGKEILAYVNITNVALSKMTFEEFTPSQPADVILSFANHSTFDGNTGQTVRAYIEKCHRILRPKGLLLFESHHPTYESQQSLEQTSRIIGEMFSIQERRVLQSKNFFDNGRTFIVAQK